MHIMSSHAAFHDIDAERQDQCQDEVDARHDKPDLKYEKCLGDDGLAAHGQIVDGDGADQSRILHE